LGVRTGHGSKAGSFTGIHKYDIEDIPHSQTVAARFGGAGFGGVGFLFYLLVGWFGFNYRWYNFSPQIFAFLVLRTSIVFLFPQGLTAVLLYAISKSASSGFRCTSW